MARIVGEAGGLTLFNHAALECRAPAIFEAIVSSNKARARAAAERHVHAGRARLLANFEEPLQGA